MPTREIRHTPRFTRDLAGLARKHRHLSGAVCAALRDVANQAQPSGMQIPGLGGQPVFKMRVPLGSRGKRGGGRIIYYCTDTLVLAMYIYAKSDRTDVPAREVRDALEELTAE